MFKLHSIVLYLFAIICCFLFGILYASMVDAGKGQMLAGGAIVLSYGVMGAAIGLLISLILAYKCDKKLIWIINGLMLISIALLWFYFHMKYKERQIEKEKSAEINIPKKKMTTAIAEPVDEKSFSPFSSQKMGLGMFTPHKSNFQTFYFYNNPDHYQGEEPIIQDSVTFYKTENNSINIKTAPPWLVPAHLKLDYNILYFKVKNVTDHYLEVIVNKTNQQSFFVKKTAGFFSYWPEFLLDVNSVEFLEPDHSIIRAKPLENSSLVKIDYSFMSPVKVSQEWMKVKLMDDNYESLGEGWIQWYKDGSLLIKYNLLS